MKPSGASGPMQPAPKSAHATGAKLEKRDLLSEIPGLRNYAVSLCGSPDRADDLVHETLLKALGSMESFTERTDLKAWLFTTMRNAYYSDYRKRRRENADPADGAAAVAKLEAPSHEGSHLDLLDFREALQNLPADQREALILIGASGLSYDEAAEICGCATGTMKSRVNRARNRLSELLGIEDHQLGDPDAVPSSPRPQMPTPEDWSSWLRDTLASLERSAGMMEEIVEDTRRDRIAFQIRSKQIDRTLACADQILADLLGESA